MKERSSIIEHGLNESQLAEEAVSLLKKLIAIPSFSREESGTADLLQKFLEEKGIAVNRKLNNVLAKNKFFSE